MAHFAILKSGNIVEQVVVVSNDIATNEQAGIEFLRNLYKDQHLPVVQTSYNTRSGVHNNNGTPLRKNYAGIGFKYDQQRDAFISPKPFNSWILNEDTCLWEAPIPMPTTELENNQFYSWNEENQSWNLTTI
jgi:hypothetical protein